MPEHQQTQKSIESMKTSQKQKYFIFQTPSSNLSSIIQCVRINPQSLTSSDILQLQRTIGNRAVGKLLLGIRYPSRVQLMPIQRQVLEEETYPSCMQRQETLEEEELLQGVFENKPEQAACPSCIQRNELEEEEPLQRKRENNTGMPDNLKAGVESLSGIDMSDVRVHYNSSKPAEVGALAYTKGTNIHVAPGQERHLPHEAWHVVQQAQGRVRPIMQTRKGVSVNDDSGLEMEADVMGRNALISSYSTKFRSSFGKGGKGEFIQSNKCVIQYVKVKPKHMKGYYTIQEDGRTFYVRTDPQGRTIKIAGIIERVNKKRTATQKTRNKRKGDQNGHLIAHSIGGPAKFTENYVAMKSEVNAIGGVWGRMEQYIRKRLEKPKTVAFMAVMPMYGVTAKRRPNKITVVLHFNRVPKKIRYVLDVESNTSEHESL